MDSYYLDSEGMFWDNFYLENCKKPAAFAASWVFVVIPPFYFTLIVRKPYLLN